jgi:hypothetical protein
VERLRWLARGGIRIGTTTPYPEGRHRRAFAGPLLLFVGVMTISHPPLSDFVCERGPALCQETFDWADQQVRVRVSTQVHLLYHAVYPTLPFAVLYGLALRRWHPSIVVSARHA